MADGPSGLTTQTISDLVNPSNEPNIKKYLGYDGNANVTDIYIAPASAQAGDSCLRQRFEYETISGVVSVRKIAWETDVWSGSEWDIA